jgi:hypothetical protein
MKIVRFSCDPPSSYVPEVNWLPPQRYLHYAKLYYSLAGYLLEPPIRQNVPDAKIYLQQPQDAYHWSNQLQRHRILWVEAWLKEIDCHDTGVVVGKK